jgi:hypothetical protein
MMRALGFLLLSSVFSQPCPALAEPTRCEAAAKAFAIRQMAQAKASRPMGDSAPADRNPYHYIDAYADRVRARSETLQAGRYLTVYRVDVSYFDEKSDKQPRDTSSYVVYLRSQTCRVAGSHFHGEPLYPNGRSCIENVECDYPELDVRRIAYGPYAEVYKVGNELSFRRAGDCQELKAQ